ncbi:MAG: SAM-dependent [Planctomycetota bacterium]|nr:MAG: SAM-dependent [Planctomycetota bacterium]
MTHEFDAYAADYDAALDEGLSATGEDHLYFARGRIRHLARVLPAAAAHPARVLDFGCGVGTASPLLIEILGAGKVVGVDVSEKCLQVARSRHASGSSEFLSVGAHSPAADFDLAYCNGVIHHVPPPERHRCLNHIARSLRPGGIFAFFENNPWNPGTRHVMARTAFDRDAVTLSPPAGRRLVSEAGFEIMRTDFLFYFPRILKAFRFLEGLGRKVPLGAQYLVLCRKG